MARLSGDLLVVNAGSTSVKLSVVGPDDRSRVVGALAEAGPIVGVAHRVVHGGERFAAPTLIDDEVLGALEQLQELAPLHNTPAVEAIASARRAFPGLPQVAVFDTAFHRTIPAVAATYLLPERFRARGIRRFGFHGLSVAWVAERVPVGRLVVCHLGGGSSVTAVAGGRSADTTMGFTPLEGVPMPTRAGSIDPGALLYLLRHGVPLAELDHALEHESGLLGLAGSTDVAALVTSPAPNAQLALEIYAYRIAQAVAAMMTALGGLDALAFTAGVGEHAPTIRKAICARLAFAGVALDASANAAERDDERVVSSAASAVDVHVIPAREDIVAARAARELLSRR